MTFREFFNINILDYNIFYTVLGLLLIFFIGVFIWACWQIVKECD